VLAARGPGVLVAHLGGGAGGGGGPPALPAGWSGQFLLGGTTRAFGPRVSPDGQWLAFVVLHQGQGQVGVMKLGSGEWWVLTRDRDRRGVLSGCRSAGSTRLFYDRLRRVPGRPL